LEQMLQRPINFEYLTIHSDDLEMTAKSLKESGAVYLGRSISRTDVTTFGATYVSQAASSGDYYLLQGQLILLVKKG
jgi:hypothetical protein